MRILAVRGVLVFGLLATVLAGRSHVPAKAASSLRGKKVLFVINTKPNLALPLGQPGRAADERIKDHLESLGFAVTVADQHDPATKAEGQDLVLISATVSAGVVEGAYKHTAVPVVTWESRIFDDMGMTGKRHYRDFGELNELRKEGQLERYLWIANAPHPLAAGLSAGVMVAASKDGRMNWGRPVPGAIIVATLPGQLDRAAIFAYEKGATLEDAFLAPARRVGFFVSNETFPSLTPAGLALFDAALRWAVAQPCRAPGLESRPAKKLLFVAGLNSPKATVDAHVKAHLESLGFVVTLAGEADSDAKAASQDLVVISSTFRAREMLGRFKQMALPIITWQTEVLGDLGMTGNHRDVDFGDAEEDRYLWPVNGGHPLSARLPGGALLKICKNGSKTPNQPWCERMGWGKPGAGSIVVATVPGEPAKAAIFAYERGATMGNDFPAPARRIAMTFLDNENFDNLNEAGLALFDSAVQWAAGKPCE